MSRAEAVVAGSRREDGVADRAARGLLVLALLAGAVRLLFLGRWSLWLDEVLTLTDARHGTDILNPVGYWLFARFYDLAGGRPDELWLRLPSALLGLASLPVCAWALRPLVGRRAAALAALLLALSPWHLVWSQTARFYTLTQLLSLVGLRLVVDGLRSSAGGARAQVLRVVSGTALLGIASATHPSATLLLGAVAVAPLALRVALGWPGSRRRDPALRETQPGAVTLGLLVGLGLATGAVWLVTVWARWEERQGIGDPLHLVLSAGYLVTPGLGLAGLVGLLSVLRGRAGAHAKVLVTTLVLGLSVAVSASLWMRVSAQYVFVFLPLVAGLAALGVLGQTGWRRLVLGAVAVVPLALESTLYFAVRHGDRPRWREAYRYVFEHRERTDLVLGNDAPVAEYYWNPRSDDLRRPTRVTYLDGYRASIPFEWFRYGRPMWFVVNREQLEDWPAAQREEMLTVLTRDCELAASFEVPLSPRDLDVHVYRWTP